MSRLTVIFLLSIASLALTSTGCNSAPSANEKPSKKAHEPQPPQARALKAGSTQPKVPAQNTAEQSDNVASQNNTNAESTESLPVHFERVSEIVKKRGNRQQCNDLNGCPMVTTLVTMGREAAPAVMAVFGRTRGDDHWRLRLLEALGRLRHPAVPPFLLKVGKSDPLQPMRAQAFLSLARHGDPKLVDQLGEIQNRFHPQKHQPELLALGYAIAALGDRETGEKIIRDHFILPPTPTKFRRWDRLRPGVYAIGQLRLRDLRPALEDIADRADPFVRREAVKSLSALRDKAALPAIALRLDDEVPGVRIAAVNALQTLTGYYNLKTPQQWRRWWNTERKRGTSTGRITPQSRAQRKTPPVQRNETNTPTGTLRNVKNVPKPALN